MPLKLGPTGKFPQGSLGPHDGGELIFAVGRDAQGLIHVDFGKPVKWFALPPEQAIELAKGLLKHAGAKKVEITL